jgi:hypothetical protein
MTILYVVVLIVCTLEREAKKTGLLLLLLWSGVYRTKIETDGQIDARTLGYSSSAGDDDCKKRGVKEGGTKKAQRRLLCLTGRNDGRFIQKKLSCRSSRAAGRVMTRPYRSDYSWMSIPQQVYVDKQATS